MKYIYKVFRKYLYDHGYKDSLIQKIWIFLQRPLQKRWKRNRIKNVHLKGEKLIRKFNAIAEDLNVECWLEFGTLLGAYRNRSFISFDNDIDMGINAIDFTENFQIKLKENGFKPVRAFYFVDRTSGLKEMTEIAYKYNGIYFDIFLSIDRGDKRKVFVYPMSDKTDTKYVVRQYMLEKYKPGKYVYINSLRCKSPSDPDEYLKSIYGDNYMTPIKGWNPPLSSPIM